jgi:thioredoxin reductase (NADPH)
MITGELLASVPLFAAIPLSERESLAARAADVRLRADDWLIREGETPSFYVAIEGSLAVFKSVAGVDQQINTYRNGDFFGEVPLLLGSPAIASVRALEPTRLMRLDSADFHALLTHCVVLNGQIMRTMAARVGALQRFTAEAPLASVTVVGRRLDPACHATRDFLVRNHVAFRWVEPGGAANDVQSDAVQIALRQDDSSFPIVCLPDGKQLASPNFRDLAKKVGLQTDPAAAHYDVTVIGGGPAGLAAAVYGASEGLRTLLIERVAPGGQAGTSSRIENYLGFPTGISGDDLSVRARQQAVRFGADVVVARTASGITGDPLLGYTIALDGDERVNTSSVVLATGVDWRRLSVPGIDEFLNRGVYYGAAQTEALGVRGQSVYLIGGGNSAGQAAMLFANYADDVTLLVRGPALAASMSQYLIDQLATKANIRIETMSEVVGAEGKDCLEFITVANRRSGTSERRACAGLFVFIGARAEVDWLPPDVIRDEWGYVCTGRDVMDLVAAGHATRWALERDPFLLETNVPGIFAAGDVRHGSIKRVAAGVGEGSMAIAFVHQYLAERRAAGNPAVTLPPPPRIAPAPSH